MARVTIDDRTLEVPDGINVIEAAALAGIDIPHFCYHPRLSVVGQCRMCLVEIEGMPKIQIACNTSVKDGMVVKVNSEKARRDRAANMEFLLINHPLDCPICDQAGECKLQDNAFGHGFQASRYDEQKRQFPGRDRTPIGPNVIADMTRCIQCTRCIRYCREIAGTGELTFIDRGGRTTVWTHDGAPLANDWSAGAADVCPVGALTTREFRFRSRVWYLEKTPSVCFGCDIGCNLSIESRDGIVYRFLPRLNPEVNDYWLCDHGRFLAESLNARGISRPLIGVGDARQEYPWGVAFDRLVHEIRRTIESGGPGALFVLGSAFLSNEENFLLKKLFGDILGVPNRDVAADSDRKRRMKSKGGWIEGTDSAAPNLRGARDMGMAPAAGGFGLSEVLGGRRAPELIYVADASFSKIADDPEQVARLRRARVLIVHARNANQLTRQADFVLPAASLAEREGTLTNFQGRVQRFERAFLPKPPVRPDWETLLLLAMRFGYGERFWTPHELLQKIAQEVDGYADLDFRELAGGSLMKKGLFARQGAV
jgi:NADH-quinone oxidoreductase subunit G